ncbi:MAG: coiled-coil domain-containing protein [Gammaproteobacteria bacterium]
MTAITFDTHEFVKRLKEAGFTEQQAEALTETIKAAQGIDLSELVTKNDLKNDLAQLEIRLMKWGLAMLAGQGAIIVALLKLL